MNDFDDLAGLREPDPIDWPTYETGGGGKPLPNAGAYTLTVAEQPTKTPHKEGYLQYTINSRILAPGSDADGREVRYTRVSTKKWPNRNASSIGDYLKSAGVAATPTSNTEYHELLPALVGVPYKARVNWEARCKVCNYRLRGQEKFPRNGEGKAQQIIDCPNCSRPGQEAVRLFANLVITSFIPVVK